MGGAYVCMPRAVMRARMSCCRSRSVKVAPRTTSSRTRANASSTICRSLAAASQCDAYWSFVQTASNRCTKSAEVTTSTPSDRTSSMVPASTREMYGMAFSGEYCIAILAGARAAAGAVSDAPEPRARPG